MKLSIALALLIISTTNAFASEHDKTCANLVKSILTYGVVF